MRTTGIFDDHDDDDDKVEVGSCRKPRRETAPCPCPSKRFCCSHALLFGALLLGLVWLKRSIPLTPFYLWTSSTVSVQVLQGDSGQNETSQPLITASTNLSLGDAASLASSMTDAESVWAATEAHHSEDDREGKTEHGESKKGEEGEKEEEKGDDSLEHEQVDIDMQKEPPQQEQRQQSQQQQEEEKKQQQEQQQQQQQLQQQQEQQQQQQQLQEEQQQQQEQQESQQQEQQQQPQLQLQQEPLHDEEHQDQHPEDQKSQTSAPQREYQFLGTWRQKYSKDGGVLSKEAKRPKKAATIRGEAFMKHSEPRMDPMDHDYELWSGDDEVSSPAVIDYNFTPRARGKNGHRAASGAISDPACATLCQSRVKDKQCWYMKAKTVGRLGNRLSEMMHAIYLTNMTGIVPGLEMAPGFISFIWAFPDYICVGRPEDFNFTARVVKGCLKHANRNHEYDSGCKNDKSWQYVELSRQYLLPYLSPDMRKCLDAPRNFDEDKLLTIHLRGEDIFGIHVTSSEYEKAQWWNAAAAPRMMEQPPCPFYKKLINSGNFTRVLIVTSQDLANPCVEWLNLYRQNLTNSKGELVKMELQTGSLEQDSCAILKAQQIAPSHSSMLHNLIVVAAALHPVTVYLSRRAFDPRWMLGCSATATNVTFHLYTGTTTRRGPTNPISGLPVPHTLTAALDW
eukprot:CAMPEP_0206502108 /NCGR_PEP_ID=MMETSP0324_2-20121206/53785_1 /ASSEMBLY_ACC=CAM_ASM_000836 /TAXON_ID=2866 /ORGANISM="Crypthecodinium cohnii, Strain Seligo" /LENGTH=679 /DNA_ID=CAMNT_0053990207 /DNA_START=83 /DNA_END=2119 /DNA_ORIENTATION=+